MKRALWLLLIPAIALELASTAQAASEIRSFEAGATTCYAVVRETDGDVWYVSGQVFEAWGTGARTAADYDIALTNKTGGMFVGDMDANIGSGQYYIVTHFQTGGSPADTDPAVFQEYGDWDGTDWIPSTITAGDVWEEAVLDHTAELTFGGEVGGLDPNITLIKAMTDLIAIVVTDIASPNDANNFTITAGIDVNDAYDWHIIMVEDADDGHSEVRFIQDWQTSRDVFVEEPFAFTPAAGDNVWIMGTGYGGYLYEMLTSLKLSKVPVYYYTQPGAAGSASESAGGVTHIDQSGADPP